jgi:hypothetical protein
MIKVNDHLQLALQSNALPKYINMYPQVQRASDASVVVNEDNDSSISCFEMDNMPLISPRRNKSNVAAKARRPKMSTTSDDIPTVVNLDGNDSSSSCFEMDDTPMLFSPRPRSRLNKFSQKPNTPKTLRRRSSLDDGILQKASSTPARRSSLPYNPAVTNPDGSSSCFEMDGTPPVVFSPRRMRFSNKANKVKESKQPSFESQAKPFMVNSEALQDSLSCFELLDESVAERRLSVSFSSTSTPPEEHLIPHLNDLSSEEKQSLWYQDQELNDIKEAAGETLRLRRKGGHLDPEEHCFQGLGPRTKKGAKERRSRWLLSLTCVLDEQKRQANDGIKNPARIAKLYQPFSQASEKVAIASAEHIAREQFITERSSKLDDDMSSNSLRTC